MTVVVANTDAMPGLAELIAERHRLGHDRYDEVWEGVYHVAALARFGHGYLQAQLVAKLTTLALPRGLFVGGPANIGLSEHDHRIPDLVVVRAPIDVVWVPTAAVVGEVVSPGDETYAKFDFYHAHHVDEILVADPAERAVTLYQRATGRYDRTDRSEVLGVEVSALAASLSWPS